ncbi:type II secretion system protein [Deinococcus sp. S9]|uniref:type II secretion system protein n=1 Tax=Deinococcus sp. S9 TaxID=2545754 RepID=UPI0010554615|nr:prepilin-type N-terminal cleavage/methylation domain-containing protein [Deinococcus sp. S9]TDE86913.1 type II secretion system protein [Deinococcus sp. S9]
MKGSYQKGFTLIELLVVLAILGILMGMFGMFYLRSIRAGEVREGANQLAADLRAARASAQRRSTPGSVRWAGTGPQTSYTLELPSGTVTRTASLPRGVYFSCLTGCSGNVVTYTAPYGEMSNNINGTRFLVKSSTTDVPALEVRVVGVTGRVMVTAVTP